MASASLPTINPTATDVVDNGYLRTLVGYNARRASLSIIEVFMERMAVYGLKVARTIADLAGSQTTAVGHVAEAVQYRRVLRSPA